MIFRRLFDVLAPGGPDSRLSAMIFHRILPERDHLFPGNPDQASFAVQLERLKAWFNIISLPEAVEGLRNGFLPPRPLVITFDDGYADNRTVALPLLRQYGVSAGFFITTGYLDGGRMWNDTVVESVRRFRLPVLDVEDLGLGQYPVASLEERRTAIERLILQLKHLPHAERNAKSEELGRRCSTTLPDNLMMTVSDVKELRNAGMTVGAHTVSHPILTGLPDELARREIADGKRQLEMIVDEAVYYFAYPNGKPGADYGAAHVQMVRDLGFHAGFSTAWGAASRGCDMFQIPRFTPWDRATTRYGLRMAQNLLRKTDMAA